MRTLTTKKGIVVETPYEDSEAMGRLLQATNRGGALERSRFAQDLAGKTRLSADQWTWVHKLVLDSERPADPVAPSAKLDGIDGLFAIFDEAKSHLKWPKLRFQLPELDVDLVTIKVAGAASKYDGQIMVTSGSWNDGTNKFYGRIARDGDFTKGKDCTDDVVAFLLRLIADPVGICADAGKKNGHCCFCYTQLSDDRSLDKGYGPICAKHWGLPWGN